MSLKCVMKDSSSKKENQH